MSKKLNLAILLIFLRQSSPPGSYHTPKQRKITNSPQVIFFSKIFTRSRKGGLRKSIQKIIANVESLEKQHQNLAIQKLNLVQLDEYKKLTIFPWCCFLNKNLGQPQIACARIASRNSIDRPSSDHLLLVYGVFCYKFKRKELHSLQFICIYPNQFFSQIISNVRVQSPQKIWPSG